MLLLGTAYLIHCYSKQEKTPRGMPEQTGCHFFFFFFLRINICLHSEVSGKIYKTFVSLTLRDDWETEAGRREIYFS